MMLRAPFRIMPSASAWTLGPSSTRPWRELLNVSLCTLFQVAFHCLLAFQEILETHGGEDAFINIKCPKGSKRVRPCHLQPSGT